MSEQIPKPKRDNKPADDSDDPLTAEEHELLGERPRDDQGVLFYPDFIEHDETATDTDRYTSSIEAGKITDMEDEDQEESLHLLDDPSLREGETDDPIKASEEGLTYVPPLEPRHMTDEDDPAHPGDEDREPVRLSLAQRVRNAIRDDDITSQYADRLHIRVHKGVVTLRGLVDDLTDSDNLLAVVEEIEGVEEVVDEMSLRS